MVLSPGTIVDRYVVDRIIGRGGMATVYGVKHSLLGSRHALKLLKDPDERIRDGLLQEGRLQARLDPTYVLPVTDVVMVDDTPALVMPLVEGCTLEDLLVDYEPTAGEVAALILSLIHI